MSTHGHVEHDSWKANLAHAFQDLKESDVARDQRLHRNQAQAKRISEHIFPAVFAQFEHDAKENGFQAKVVIQPNGVHRLILEGPSVCNIDFQFQATPDALALFATRQGGARIDLLQQKKPEDFHEVVLVEYLVKQLREISPKR